MKAARATAGAAKAEAMKLAELIKAEKELRCQEEIKQEVNDAVSIVSGLLLLIGPPYCLLDPLIALSAT